VVFFSLPPLFGSLRAGERAQIGLVPTWCWHPRPSSGRARAPQQVVTKATFMQLHLAVAACGARHGERGRDARLLRRGADACRGLRARRRAPPPGAARLLRSPSKPQGHRRRRNQGHSHFFYFRCCIFYQFSEIGVNQYANFLLPGDLFLAEFERA